MMSKPRVPTYLSPFLCASPRGVPRVSPAEGGLANNCWVSASVALLASDPVIAMFVNDVWGAAGLRFGVGNGRPLGGHLAALLACIYMVNCVDTPDEGTFKAAARVLYQQEMKHDDDDMGDAITDSYDRCHELVREAMRTLWGLPALCDWYETNGLTAHTNTSVVCLSCDASITTKSEKNGIEVASFGIDAHKTNAIDLEYEINFKKLMHSAVTERKHEEGAMVAHTVYCNNRAAVAHTRTLVSLPWRFSVSVNRVPDKKGAVLFNPRSLVLGPTEQGDYANYRLVAAVTHHAVHWTTLIHHAPYEAFDEDAYGWPNAFYHLSWAQNDGEPPTTKELVGGYWHDTESNYYVFERHE